MNYTIFADSACDISQQILDAWGVKQVKMSFRFTDEDKEYACDEMSTAEFYADMRSGRCAKTSAINSETFHKCFAEEMEQGKDILYLAFSSGLSGTCQAAQIAAEEIRTEYPDRQIAVVDSLCASAGYGLLLKLVTEEKKRGASLLDCAAYAEKMKLRICHWFTVESLEYLKRGGRISATTALVGGLLNIKPVLHVDNVGHLVGVKNVRGRRSALEALVKKTCEAVGLREYPIYICHADCREEAERLAQKIREQCGEEVDLITDIGPIIGAHSGPGTIAVFFVDDVR